MKDKKYRKVKDHSHYTGKFRGTAHNMCNFKYSVPKKIPIVFHNGSNYNYHFIIKELAEELKKITCLENTEKYITFTVPIEKEDRRIDKYGEEITKKISYILQLIDRAKFMTSPLPNFYRIHRIKCKYGLNDKKCETCGIKYKYCDCFLEYTNFKDDLVECKCLLCNKNCQRKFDEKLKERFFDIYKFSNNDNNRFLLSLQKVFILINIWMIGNSSMKHRYLKKKTFTVT